MALKEALMVKTVVGDSDLELTALAGQSLLVHGINVAVPVADYVTLICDRTAVGYWRVGGTLGNHLFFPNALAFRPNLFALMVAAGLMQGYPVPEGKTFSIEGAAQATSRQQVVYSVHDAADFQADAPNGPGSRNFVYPVYGRYSTTLAEGLNEYITPQTPVEFPAFPFGSTAPAGRTIRLHGVAFADVQKDETTGTNKQWTDYLKLVKERETLFDEDRAGLLYLGAAATANSVEVAVCQSQGGLNSDVDPRPPLWFPAPLDFGANEELNVFVGTVLNAGAVTLAAADCEVCFIAEVMGAR